MARRRFTDAEKAHALDVYATEGPAEAARQTGIPKGTIASWAHRTGTQTVCNERAAARVEAAQMKWAERRQAMVDRIGTIAEKALTVVEDNLDLGTTSKAKDAATTMAILVDKAQLLGGDATTRHENRELRDRLLDEAREHARHLRSVA